MFYHRRARAGLTDAVIAACERCEALLADARAGDIVTVASEGPIAGNSRIFAWCELDY